jgi:hypothetical protein
MGLEMAPSFSEGRPKGKLSDDNALNLDRRPFVASDRKLFAYATGKKSGKLLDEDAARAKLTEFLGATDSDPANVESLIARFDDPAAVELVSDPSLRAAVLMLGAVHPWELVLPAVFDGKNPDGVPLRIVFIPMRDSAPAARLSDRDGDDDVPALAINSLLIGESPQLLASVIVEAVLLHDDDLLKEEAIAAAAFGTLAWADIMNLDPGVAAGRTWGVLQRNQYLLALLNTGANDGQIGILANQGDVDDILPGVFADAPTFADFINARPWGIRFTRRGELVAPNIFGNLLTAAGVTPTKGVRDKVTYGDATLADLDSAIAWFLPPEKVHAIATTLKLGTALK